MSSEFWGSVKSSLIKSWENAKPAVIEFIKNKIVKFLLKKVFGMALVGGPKVWLVKFILEELFEEIAEPLIKFSFRWIGYKYDVKDGKHTLERIENAENINEWRDSIRDA